MAPLPSRRRSFLPWLGLAALIFFAVREAIARAETVTSGDSPAARAGIAPERGPVGRD